MFTERWEWLKQQASSLTPNLSQELAQLNHDVPTMAQQIAKARQRWRACLACAREHEDAAMQLRREQRSGRR